MSFIWRRYYHTLTGTGSQAALVMIMACAVVPRDVVRRLLTWSERQGVDVRDRDRFMALRFAPKGEWAGVGKDLFLEAGQRAAFGPQRPLHATSEAVATY